MKLKAKEICLFAMTGALMFASMTAMEALPNIHPVTMLICAVTIVFGPKAIWSVAVYVFLIGFYNGFNLWWIPYVYIWLPPYLMTLAIPWKRISKIASTEMPLSTKSPAVSRPNSTSVKTSQPTR